MSDNKQPKIALFLGAGASVPFGKPTTKELKNELLEEYKKLENEIRSEYAGKSPNPRAEELWFSILLHSILSFDEFGDIEHVLQALKELHAFFIKSQYGGRYVQSLILSNYGDKYSPDSVQDWRFSEYIKTIAEQRKRLEKRIFYRYQWDKSYTEALGQIYDPLFGEIKKYSKDIRVFTTNYDRAIEVYCSKSEGKCRCVYGFRYDEVSERRLWNKDEGFEFPSSVKEGVTIVYLYKLHGSLNWKKDANGEIEAITGETPISDPSYVEDMLIYPTVSPKTGQQREPYKTIRERFKKELLESTDVCIIIGFSFRDGHIKSIFSDFIKLGTKTLIVVSRSADENIRGYLLKKYKKLPQSKKTHGVAMKISRCMT